MKTSKIENVPNSILFQEMIETNNLIREAMAFGDNEVFRAEGKKFQMLLEETIKRDAIWHYEAAVREAAAAGELRYI